MTLPCSYSTVGKVFDTYPMIGSVTNITSSHIAGAIGAEQVFVEAKLAARYAIPFSPVPPLIETIVTDLATFRLLTQRVFTQERMNASVWPDAFKRGIEVLDALAAGSMALVSGSGTVIAETAGTTIDTAMPWSNQMNSEMTFDEGDWEFMHVGSFHAAY